MTLYHEPWTVLTDAELDLLLTDEWYEKLDTSNVTQVYSMHGILSRTLSAKLDDLWGRVVIDEDTRPLQKLRGAMTAANTRLLALAVSKDVSIP